MLIREGTTIEVEDFILQNPPFIWRTTLVPQYSFALQGFLYSLQLIREKELGEFDLGVSLELGLNLALHQRVQV